MLASSLLGLLAAATLGATSPTRRYIDHVVHESRKHTPVQWSKREDFPLNPGAPLPLRFGLRQQNLHRMYQFIDSVSNPLGENYGQHWTQEQVASTFAPSDESIEAVTKWLLETGIADHRIKVVSSGLWISVNTTLEEAEMLLNTKYHAYDHDITGQGHVACERSYSIPRELSEHHVDLIVPTLHFDVPLRAPTDGELRRRGQRANKESLKQLSHDLAIYSAQAPGSGEDLDSCNNTMTPACVRGLYSFPLAETAAKHNSYGIVEFSPTSYLGSDLDAFFALYAPSLVGQRPIEVGIDGGAEQPTIISTSFQSLPDLNLEWAMALVAPQNVTLLQAGDDVVGANFNTVLDALDASYCTYKGGDDPDQDPRYPDLYPGGQGYDGPKACGTVKPPAVLSTSANFNEVVLTPFYEERQCNEYAKLGLMGTTVIYPASTYGVAGNGGLCLDENNVEIFGEGRYNPTFPGSCPYVTSVGSTQAINGISITATLAAGGQPEEPMSIKTIYGPSEGYGFTGGGFSNVFAMPEYQASAVRQYLNSQVASLNSTYFASTGHARAFPDVSANAIDYAVIIDGNALRTAGASCATTTFGSLIAQINGERLAAGKSTVGFINPALYAHPEVLKDVTLGNSPGCGTNGFPSAEGWDPVTGLGTPNYPKMLELFMSLP